jgi:hypothetical protein
MFVSEQISTVPKAPTLASDIAEQLAAVCATTFQS